MIEIIKADNHSNKEFVPPLEAFVLKENEDIRLSCVFEITKETAQIYDIAGEGGFVFLDALVRAVASYSLGRGADRLYTKNKGLFEALQKLGFERTKTICEGLEAKAERLLKKCCGGDNKT